MDRKPATEFAEEAIRRDGETLLRLLDRIDAEGWDCATATRLLTFIRIDLARPVAIDAGLRGAAASQGEATAWEAVWVKLTEPGLREASSPWGVLWRVAKRAVVGEIYAARFAASAQRGLSLSRFSDTRDILPPVSLDVLADRGWHPSEPCRPDDGVTITDILHSAREGLEAVGWPAALARRIVAEVVDMPSDTGDSRCTHSGWRLMADGLGLPPWQARRLTVALRGTSSWSGILARLATDGPDALDTPAVRSALLSTRTRRHRSPVLAATRAEAESRAGRAQAA